MKTRPLAAVAIWLTLATGPLSGQESLLDRANVAGPVAHTPFGIVQGFSPDGHTLVWKGVPYAQPPVGALRWKAPLDPVAWTGVRDATSDPGPCAQQVYDKYWRSSDAFTGSEDCLYLNVYRPRTHEKDLPVYVFIHGGSNSFGSVADYDPGGLARRGNIVVVTIQYRVSALGFLTHPALRQSGSARDKSGDYGTLDQLKALGWVRESISAFGGDPAKVVVGGQSSGAGNTMTILASPLSRGLFRGAVLQSLGMLPYTREEADEMTNETIDGLLIRDGRASDAEGAAAVRAAMKSEEIEVYLRDKTAEEILRARRDGTDGKVGFMPAHEPIQDGYVVPTASWADAIADGMVARVPVLIGSTRDEWKDFMPVYGDPVKELSGGTVPSGDPRVTWASLFNVIGVGPRMNPTDVLPLQADRDFYALVASLKSRLMQAYGVDDLARSLTAADARRAVYAYRFDWSGGGDPALADFGTYFGAAHSMDVPFFQGGSRDAWDLSFTPANREGRVALQGVMMDYLASFVRTLDPNPRRSFLPTWPRWSLAMGGRQAITFDADLHDARLGIDTTEETMAGLAPEIDAARDANPNACWVFELFALHASRPTNPPCPKP